MFWIYARILMALVICLYKKLLLLVISITGKSSKLLYTSLAGVYMFFPFFAIVLLP